MSNGDQMFESRLVFQQEGEERRIVHDFQGRHDVRIREVRLAPTSSLRGAIVAIGKALDAPDYFGANLDALVDVLDDRPKGHDVLLVRGLDEVNASVRKGLLNAFRAGVGHEQSYGEGKAWIMVLTHHAPKR